MKVGHVCVWTPDINASIEFYKKLGAKEGLRSLLDIGGGKTKDLLHMVFDGEVTIELCEPSDKSMLPAEPTGIIEHFCFEVDDIDAAVADLKAKGIDTFVQPEPMDKEIFGGCRIIFLTGPSGEQIELFEDCSK